MNELSVLECYVAGHITKLEVCEDLNMSTATLGRRLKKYGIGIGRGRKQTLPIPEPCKHCGKIRDNIIKNRGRMFCNAKCYGNYKKLHPEEFEVKESTRILLKQNGGSRHAERPWRVKETTPEYKRFVGKVHRLSQKVYEQYKDEINPNNYKRTLCGVKDGWQLDHIIPISEGFKIGLSPEEIACKENLQMLPWKTNLMKEKGHHIF